MALLAKIDVRRSILDEEIAWLQQVCAEVEDVPCTVLDLAVDTATARPGRVAVTRGFDRAQADSATPKMANCIRAAIRRGSDAWFARSAFAKMFDFGKADYDYTHEVVQVEHELYLDPAAGFAIGFVLKGELELHIQGFNGEKAYGARSFVRRLCKGTIFVLDDDAQGCTRGDEFHYRFGVWAPQL
jgi:hypothetical protein